MKGKGREGREERPYAPPVANSWLRHCIKIRMHWIVLGITGCRTRHRNVWKFATWIRWPHTALYIVASSSWLACADGSAIRRHPPPTSTNN